MLEAGLALRPVRSTPAGTDRRGAARRALPEDLLRQASRRLGILALVAASLWLIAPLAGHAAALALGDPRWAQLDFADHVSAFSCAVSIALVLYVRSSTRSPVFILDLGLAYLVLTALELSIMMHWSPIPEALRNQTGAGNVWAPMSVDTAAASCMRRPPAQARITGADCAPTRWRALMPSWRSMCEPAR